MIKQKFPDNPAETAYCIFDTELEDDPLVLFHATPAENYDSIIKNGFKPGIVTGKSILTSVSFAHKSSSVLGMAGNQQEYCIFAVRYQLDALSSTRDGNWCRYDDNLNPPPEIIGYCIVPTDYQHV
jgi:hypothetical protein